MSHEIMLEDIKAELDHLDAVALQSIRKIIAQSKRNAAASSPKNGGAASPFASEVMARPQRLAFAGENLTLEEFERQSLKERAMLKRRLKDRNQQWLQEKFSALDAAWVMVIDGEVIASGKNLKDKPRPPQTVKISQRTGKFPFVFVNDKFITIEESASSWHKFDYFDKFLLIELPPTSGEPRSLEAWVACVLDWNLSPFIAINPNRTALVGRDILLELKPNVRLDFDQRETEILAKAKPRRTHPKGSRGEKRAKPRPSRRH